MKTKVKLGYGHMDMSNSIYKEYIKGNHEISKFNPNACRAGTFIAIVDSFGGDRVPISLDFDYGQLDCDMIYLWLQGGAPNGSLPVQILKKIRREWDGVVLINWEEIYWFTDLFCQKAIEGYLEGTKYIDGAVCPYIGFDERVKKLGFPQIPVKYAVIPYDTKWLTCNFFDMEKVEPKRIYGTVHGRASRCDKTLLVMNAIKNRDVTNVINRYRFITATALKIKESKRIGMRDFSFVNIIDTIDPWEKYVEYLARSFMFVDEYPAYSSSHTTMDAACIGTPTVSHRFNSVSTMCFPEVTVNDFNNIKEWIHHTERLLTDEDFYNTVRNKAVKRADHYSIENYYKQLEAIYKEVKR